MMAHWGAKDPAAANGDDRAKAAAFAKAFQELRKRIETLVNLPLETLSEPRMKGKLEEMGRVALADPGEKGDQR